MDSNTLFKQLKRTTHLENLVRRRKYKIKALLQSLPLEDFIEVAELALAKKHLPLLDEHCCKKALLGQTVGRKEKTRILYLLKTYEKTILEKLIEDTESVSLILTWAFVNRISVEEFMK